MKKLVLTVAALFVAIVSFGQVQWGIIAGPNFSAFKYRDFIDGNSKRNSSILTTFRGGVTVDIPLTDECGIGTGLLYEGKGGKFKDTDTKALLSYLQLPVTFQFSPEVGNGRIVLGVGPYFALGVGGNYKNTINGNVGAFDNAAGVYQLKRFDFGGTLNIGYQLPMGLYFGLNGDVSFLNSAKYTDNDRKFNNGTFGVSVGYKFHSR
ncbi:porin family protein [Chitinophaga sp. Cy-1792]|uniref:porin family protein n=1 Tax=Chitinophaga sp. Cy-1792 TaxID=2608339 RepID=UPI00142209EC|nr:porin family protein [Chitinophaga sp. Cy-1792]NIG52299.1 PorT family protein [Chitinophaga sp. Cy-1792]